jgi:hypothetical protein
MTTLLDIAPVTKTVKIGNQEKTIHGIGAHAIANLFQRFPQLRMLFSGMEVDVTKIAPDAGVAIIAAAIGKLGDKKEEQAAATILNLEAQWDILEAVLELTLPSGVGPFARRIAAMLEALTVGVAESTKEADTRSLRRSNSASAPATNPFEPGPTRRAS